MRIAAPPSLHRICVYAHPKAGKSRFVTSLPWDTWGDAIYVAADQNAECLDGVMLEDRKHLRIEKPVPATGEPMPFRDAAAIASTDWSKEEGTGVLIWDTMTQTSRDMLAFFAKQGKFAGQKGPVTFGTPGRPDFFANPTEGDYGAAQSATDHLLGLLFQQKLHLIVVFHAAVAKMSDGMMEGLMGGPQTVGSAQIYGIARPFSAVLHLEAGRTDKGTKYMVRSTPHGIWQANVRALGSLPDKALTEHPTDYWREFHKLTKGE